MTNTVTRRDRVGATEWPLWSTTMRLVTTDASALDEARSIVDAELDRVERACSRFRADSETSRLTLAAGPVTISDVLAELVSAALDAARATDGDVDPTLGAELVALGYDRDFAAIAGRDVPITFFRSASWDMVQLHGRMLTVPRGVELDLGATAKAIAADRCAKAVASALDVGVLVGLGGDIATAGPAPAGGWQIRVQDTATDDPCFVSIPAGAAIATSSTQKRRWTNGGRQLHHILDPASGAPADPVWRTVSVVAWNCLRANMISTASIVRGHRAPALIEGSALAARLVAADGHVRTVGPWPSTPVRVP